MSDIRKTKAQLVSEVRELREKFARLESALGQTDARMRSLIDLAPVMVWEIDPDGIITLSQGRALEIIGYAPGELVGTDAKDLFGDEPLLAADIEEILSGKEMTTTRVFAGRLIEARHTPVLDADGKLERVIGVGIDVTEQREGEVNLRELSDRFSLAQRIARLGSWEWDLRDGRQIWSDETYEIFGVSPDSFTPHFDSFLEFVHEEARHRVRAALNRSLADADTSFGVQHRIVLGDGTVRHLQTRGEMLQRQGSKPQRMIGTCQDVTEQVLADAALQESERRFALFMDHLPAAVMIKDHESKLLYANKYMREVFAPPLRRVRKASAAMPKKIVDGWLAADRRALKEGRHECEENIPDHTGGYRWMHTVKFALPRDEAPHMIGGISWDIDARRTAEEALQESERRYRSLWENAPIGLWLEDSSGVVQYLEDLRARGVEDLSAYFDEHPAEIRRCASLVKVLSVNQAAVDLHGASDPAELCVGLDEILDEEAMAAYKQVLMAIAEGRTSMDFETCVETPDGEIRTFAVHFFTPSEYERTWQQTIIATTDISERRRMEEELRPREAASRALLDGISHELKTPLNSIIGFTGVILQGMAGGLNDEQRRQLGMARQSAGHMLGLIEDVIDVTRLQTGSLEVEREVVDLGGTAARVVDEAGDAAAAKGLELDVEIPAGLPAVAGDRRRVRQVLANLVENAIKFTETGAVRIDCREADGRVEARVADTGPGVAPELRTRIFEPFQGAGSTTGTREEGTGLGLHLSRGIARLLGGDLVLECEAGGGSTFVLTLPVQADTIEPSTTEAAP